MSWNAVVERVVEIVADGQRGAQGGARLHRALGRRAVLEAERTVDLRQVEPQRVVQREDVALSAGARGHDS